MTGPAAIADRPLDDASSASASRRKSPVWANLLLAVVAVVITLEGPVRILQRFVAPQGGAYGFLRETFPVSLRERLEHDFANSKTRIKYDFDMFLGWRARPNQDGLTYRINEHGRRDAGDPTASDEIVVLLTGGSAAWSFGASDNEHTLAAALERALARRLGRHGKVRVLNYAEQAYGLRQEGIRILDAVQERKPSLVIFYDGVNDTHTVLQGKDPNRYRTWTTFPDILKEALRETTGSPFVLDLNDVRDASMTWRLASRLAHAIRPDSEPAVNADEQGRTIRAFFQEQVSQHHQVLSALGVPALFALQPIGYVSKPPHEDEPFLRRADQAAPWRDAYRATEEAYGALRGNGVPTVLLTEVFRDEARHVYIDPTHLNDLGNELVAEQLAAAAAATLSEARPTTLSGSRP